MKRTRSTCVLAILVLLSLTTGCKDQLGHLFDSKSDAGDVQAAAQKTLEGEQWEYLVLSFGKTLFGDIEDNIISGDSKLAAFQEFSTLLAGSEALNLQKKMDILGRFGWEAIEVVGQIGGDQQLMFKRQRRSDRIEAEKLVIARLSSILKQEEAEKEAKLKEFYAELRAMEEKKSAAQRIEQSDELVELDAKEQNELDTADRNKLTQSLKQALEKVVESSKLGLPKGMSLCDVSYDLRTSRGRSGRIDEVGGSLTITLDGTPLLKKENTYRRSAAKIAVEEYIQLFKKQPGIWKVSGYSWECLTLEVVMYISHGDKDHQVASNSVPFTVKGFEF